MNTATLAAAVTAGATVGLVAVAWWQLRKLDRNMDLQLYSDYTKRYQELVLRLPPSVLDGTASLDDVMSGSPESGALVMGSLRAYFDLCYQQWFLHTRCAQRNILGKHERLEKTIWRDWEQGMAASMRCRAIREAWLEHFSATFGAEFREFMAGRLDTAGGA